MQREGQRCRQRQFAYGTIGTRTWRERFYYDDSMVYERAVDGYHRRRWRQENHLDT
jgi:hypothetical protein